MINLSLRIFQIRKTQKCLYLKTSVENDEPVCCFSFISGKNNEIRKEYLGIGN